MDKISIKAENSNIIQSYRKMEKIMVNMKIKLVQLGDPLPGYTGFNKRVLANNIFGKTYA